MRKSLNGYTSKPPVDDVGRHAGVAGADGVVRPRQQFGREARLSRCSSEISWLTSIWRIGCPR